MHKRTTFIATALFALSAMAAPAFAADKKDEKKDEKKTEAKKEEKKEEKKKAAKGGC